MQIYSTYHVWLWGAPRDESTMWCKKGAHDWRAVSMTGRLRTGRGASVVQEHKCLDWNQILSLTSPWPCANLFNSLGLSCLTYTMEIVTVPTPHGHRASEWLTYKPLRAAPRQWCFVSLSLFPRPIRWRKFTQEKNREGRLITLLPLFAPSPGLTVKL